MIIHSILFFLQLMHIPFPNKLLFYVLICRTFIGNNVRIGINFWHILIKNKMWTIVDSCHVVLYSNTLEMLTRLRNALPFYRMFHLGNHFILDELVYYKFTY